MARRARTLRGLYWPAVLLSLLLLAGGGFAAYLGFSSAAGPQGAVEGYFAALQRGDAAAALAYGDLPDGPRTLLTGAVLRQQLSIAPIRDVQVISVAHPRAGRAIVTIRYSLGYARGSRQITDQVPVYRRGSSWNLVRTAVPTTIELTHARDRATIAGAGIPAGRTLLFPGAVPVTFDTPYLQVTSGTVTFGSGKHVEVSVAVSPAGKAAVAGALKTTLQHCLADGGAGRCPLPSDRYVPGSLRGRLLGSAADRMVLSVAPDADGAIDVAGTIAFRGSYRKLDYDNIARARHGTIRLPLNAVAYAVQPVVIEWTPA